MAVTNSDTGLDAMQMKETEHSSSARSSSNWRWLRRIQRNWLAIARQSDLKLGFPWWLNIPGCP
ncbi:hypothetical protein LINGRAHAP2_LOCUS9389 [Linum grandiflorum]